MDQKILEQLEQLNKNINDIFLFLLSKEGYTKDQIRLIFGSLDNNRATKIKAGLKNRKNGKQIRP